MFRRVYIAIVLTLSFACQVQAQQWQGLYTLPSMGGSNPSIISIYFLDHFGAPDTGFLGTTNGIFQTTNGGTSWHPCANTLGLNIADFTFKDALTGWAVATNTPVVAKTTDGGTTWTHLTTIYAGTTIRYASKTQTIFMSYPIVGEEEESTDFGATWTLANANGTNGLAFADSACGIWSSHGNFPFLWTTDGGTNWQSSNIIHHIYSPTALGTSHSFFALSEYDDSGYFSNDSGRTWNYRGNSVGPPGYFAANTGCVQSWNGYLWYQGDGLFLSSDTGKTWNALCGPHTSFDSRFYARGKTLFATDGQDLSMDPDGTQLPPPTELLFQPDSMVLRVPPCGMHRELLYVSPLTGCFAELDSLYVTGSPNLTAIRLILPAPLGALEFALDYRDGGRLFDTGFLHVVWRTAGLVKDTVLPVYGSVGGTPQTLSVLSLDEIPIQTCSAFDTTLSLTSLACDTLTILNAHLADTSLLTLKVPLFPVALLPGGSLKLRLVGTFSHPGTYQDSLHITFLSAPSHTVKDTTIPILIRAYGVPRPMVHNITIHARNGCAPIDTFVYVENMHCAGGILDSISVSDSTILLVTDSVLPIALPSDAAVAIHLRVQPAKSGSLLAMLKLHFIIDGASFDTDIFVTIITTSKPSPIPVLSQPKIAFGPSSLCFAKMAMVVLRNPQCDPLTLTLMRWTYPDPQFSIVGTPNLPLVLAPNALDTFWIRYQPIAPTYATASLTLTFTLDGFTHDTVIGVSGIGTDAPTVSTSVDTLSFPTLTTCTTRTDSTCVINTSCDTLLLTGITQWSPGGYNILTSLPDTLAPGDSVQMAFLFAPASDGSFQNPVDIQFQSKASGSKTFRQRLFLSGMSSTPHVPASIEPATFGNLVLAPCEALDTSFTIHNPNSCDTITLDSLRGNQAGFTIFSPSLPAAILADSEITVRFHFAPEQDTERVQLHLAGTNLDSLLSFATFRTHNDSLSITPGSTSPFTTTPCQPVAQTFLLSGGACDSLEIDSLMLSGGSKFLLTGDLRTPFVLTGTDTLMAEYDPLRSGSDSTQLIVTSTNRSFAYHIPLAGSISNVPQARCGIRIDGRTSDTLTPGSAATIALVALDPIPDSLGLTDISYTLTYNDVLLTKLRIDPGPGFVLQSSLAQSGTLSLRFVKTSAGNIQMGDIIGGVDFAVSLGDTMSTPIVLSNLRFNHSDSNYETCTLSATEAQDSDLLIVSSACGFPILQQDLRSRNLVVFGIESSIKTSGATVAVDLEVHAASTVHISLFTEDGVELARFATPLEPGRHTVPVSLGHIPSGPSFIQIVDGREEYVRKIAFE